MEMLLRIKGLWKYCEPKEESRTESISGKDKDLDGDSRTRARIALNVDPKFYELIREKTTAREVWRTLKEYFVESILATKIQLKSRFYTMVMSESESLSEYIDRVKEVWEKLKNLGDLMPEIEVVFKILCTVTKKYEFIMMAAAQLPEEKLTIGFLKGQFRMDDTRKIVRSATKLEEKRGEEALFVKRESAKCFKCGKKGHFARECEESSEEYENNNKKRTGRRETAAIAF